MAAGEVWPARPHGVAAALQRLQEASGTCSEQTSTGQRYQSSAIYSGHAMLE
jgi:hypothetical protein